MSSSFRLPTSVSGWTAAGVGVAAVAALATALYKLITNKRQSIRACRPAHFVFKVGDLRSTVAFYEKILGMKVQRHEEFDKGCAATCNGPYSGWWSKTMMSITSEDDFSIELTYNYGVDSYRLGNDLAGIHVAIPGAADRAKAMGVEVMDTPDSRVKKILNPDGQAFFLHEDAVPGADPFLYVSLNTEDINRATDYYVNVLGMKIYSETSSSVLLGYDSATTKVELIALPAGEKVDHADSFGRMAFGNFEVINTFNRVKNAGDEVINPPITLDTPDKASVLVTILRDRDGNEICMVDDADFRRLCITKPGDEVINWNSRAKRIKAQSKFAAAFGQ